MHASEETDADVLGQTDLLGTGLPAVTRALRLVRAALPGRSAAVAVAVGTDVSVISVDEVGAGFEDTLIEAAQLVLNRETHSQIVGDFAVAPITASNGREVALLAVQGSTDANDDLFGLLDDLVAGIESDIWLRRPRHEDSEWNLSLAISAINSANSLGDVASALRKHGRLAAKAKLLSVVIVPPDLETNADRTLEPLGATLRRVSAEERGALSHAASTGQSYIEAESAIEGCDSFIAVPLLDISGLPRLIVGFGYDNALENEFSSNARRLCAIAAQATARVAEHQVAQDHAEVLAAVVIPDSLPELPGLELAGQYLPPSRSQRVGGDVYDVWRRSDGTVGLFVADVAGHSLQSTRTAALLRHAAGTLTLQMKSPRDVLRVVNQYLQQSPGHRFATCCYCVIDSTNGTLTVASAGHPQPRVIRASGDVEAVGPRGETLLGFGEPAYSEQATRFSYGDTLVVFSDGLIERRGFDLSISEAQFEAHLQTDGATSAASLVDRLIEQAGSENDDDVVVLAVRREATPRTFSREWQAQGLDLGDVRSKLSGWLGSLTHNVDQDAVLLVATELMTNARRADADGVVSLRCSASEDTLVLAVTNAGEQLGAFAPMPSAATPGGRGLPIVAALASSVVTSHNEDGQVTVEARFDT